MKNWENPKVVNENMQPAHSLRVWEQGISLNGKWRFSCASSPDTAPEEFFAPNFDVAKWDEIDVPCCWETRGYGQPYYFGANFPKAISQNEKEIPRIDHSLNFVGSYRRDFEIPVGWEGKKIVLRFGTARSALECWVNGEYVGLAKGSMLPIEFDITNVAKTGTNTVCARVYNFSDASYIEDQDMWFLSGLYRDVNVYALPQTHIADAYAHASFEDEYKKAKLIIEATLCNAEGCDVNFTLSRGAKSWYGAAKVSENSAKAEIEVDSPELWSAEKPNLYRITVSLVQNGKIRHEHSFDFGFREIKIDAPELQINGKPLKLRGVNYHAFTPDKGYYVPRDVLEKDIATMKRMNINAVRTSHYPQDEYFYDLCNKWGIYVMDECSVETHAVRDKGVPHTDIWTGHVVDRMERMVRRDRNHPCVVIWSLGNESHVGQNHYRMKEKALSLDATRPIHYEGGSDLQLSDFCCDGYSHHSREQLFADGADVEKKKSLLQTLLPINLNMSLDKITYESYKNHPVIATEYGHCMGNCGTDFEKHMMVYEGSKQWCGGFIWDFKDKSLCKGEVNGKPFYAYGGDFGEYTQGGFFCCNGMTDRNGEPHQVCGDIHKGYQPIMCERLADGSIKVTNRHSFTNTNEYTCLWEVLKDGYPYANGEISVDTAPRSESVIASPCACEFAEAGEYFLALRFANKYDTAWAKAGHVAAYEQWRIADVAAEKAPMGCGASVSEKKGKITLSAAGISYVVDKKTGDIVSISGKDGEMLKKALRPMFHRVKTDGELGFMGIAMGGTKKLDSWAKLSLADASPKGAKVKIDAKNDIVTVSSLKKALTRAYTILPDGSLKVEMKLNTGKKPPNRIGMSCELAPEYANFAWYGKGKHDTYWGREFSGTVGRWQQSVTEQDEHVRPQEHGNKRGVRELKLTNTSGKGLEVKTCGEPICAGVWPYTLGELQAAEHIHDLPDHHTTTLNINCVQNGLGDSFIRCTENYKIQANTEYGFAFIVKPL